MQLELLRLVALGVLGMVSLAAETMPVAQQNAMIQTYCAVCHTDASMNGGLSLQHFDAAMAAPSLKAMLLSKITGGALLATVRSAPTNAEAAEFVNKRLKTGAMAASGVREPELTTMAGLAYALAEGSARADEWSAERQAGSSTVSILREARRASESGSAESYRLIVTCDGATRQGTMQVAWSPAAQTGKVTVEVDSRAPRSYVVDGMEEMGDGKGAVTKGLSAIYVADDKTSLELPIKSVAVSDLFPGDVVTFPFGELSKGAREELRACFPSQ